jgi:hypothetical protein
VPDVGLGPQKGPERLQVLAILGMFKALGACEFHGLTPVARFWGDTPAIPGHFSQLSLAQPPASASFQTIFSAILCFKSVCKSLISFRIYLIPPLVSGVGMV